MLKQAHEEVEEEEDEEEEDEHLYHTTGWSRELWIKALGMKAVLPPPEEEKKVKTAIGAARAKAARKSMQGRRQAAPDSQGRGTKAVNETKVLR